jgi:GNAT superfamily N-acetyltransferase
MNDQSPIRLRPPHPGELALVAHRQMLMYQAEYGWDWTYEGLACEILGHFIREFEPEREAAWIAERDGVMLGSVFLMKTEDRETGKLRLLYVEPAARGLGLGRRLVKVCVERARAAGYRKLSLWTNDVLSAARRTYETEGFVLTASERHRSFGFDLVGETWTLELVASTDAWDQPPTVASSRSSPRQVP